MAGSIAFVWGAVPARAQEVDAPTLASHVQSFYDRTKTVQSSFYQTYYHKLYDRYERSKGKVVFKKPGMMRWDYARPNGKVIVSDGKRVQVFDPGGEGERPQLLEQRIGEHQLPQAFAFLTGTGRLEEEFRFRLLDPKRQGFRGGHVLELRPKEPSPHYDRILFYVQLVGKGSRKAGVVRRVLIVDPAGNRNRFDFSKLAFNRDVSRSRFDFRPPRGTRRVRN
ncbi:MAG: LolA family protein [Myxococcota bacterium]